MSGQPQIQQENLTKEKNKEETTIQKQENFRINSSKEEILKKATFLIQEKSSIESIIKSKKEILKFCLERGFLIDSETLYFFSENFNSDSVISILEKIMPYTKKNILTKKLFEQNTSELAGLFLDLPESHKKKLLELRQTQELINSPETKIKILIEEDLPKNTLFSSKGKIQKKTDPLGDAKKESFFGQEIKILSNPQKIKEKLDVMDFTNYFRNRFNKMKEILQNHPKLDNLISIDKLFGNKKGISIIGLVYSKSVTKNKNIILEVEDTTGKIKILVNNSKKELYGAAEEISLDSVLGFKCSGNREILFANEIIFPDSAIPKRKKSFVEEYALFIGDLHFGSKLFLKDGFLKFIDYLNGNLQNTMETEKIKYLFIVGDLVTGVGNYPNQEADLAVSDVENQFIGLAELLKKIPKHIKIIIIPGNHDAVRLMEPQPILDEKYAWPLHQLDNVILLENPSMVNIGAKKNFDGFNVLCYHGFSYPYYANIIPSLIEKRAMNCPEEIVKYLLKNRHLAPTHGSTQYYPYEEDKLVISEVPDIFVCGHTHKSGVSYYNNTLIISVSCWEAMTPYQEKFGNEPDHCKVPLFNLKTGAIKILDFEEDGKNED